MELKSVWAYIHRSGEVKRRREKRERRRKRRRR